MLFGPMLNDDYV